MRRTAIAALAIIAASAAPQASAPLAMLGLGAAPAAAASHHDCRIHGFRPYLHRHVGADDRVVSCDRPAQLGTYPTAARCVAHGLRRNGQGPVVPGTQISVEIPYPPDAPAYIRAERMNIACGEAIEGCYHASEGAGRGIECAIVDQGFVR